MDNKIQKAQQFLVRLVVNQLIAWAEDRIAMHRLNTGPADNYEYQRSQGAIAALEDLIDELR